MMADAKEVLKAKSLPLSLWSQAVSHAGASMKSLLLGNKRTMPTTKCRGQMSQFLIVRFGLGVGKHTRLTVLSPKALVTL